MKALYDTFTPGERFVMAVWVISGLLLLSGWAP